MNTPSTWLLDFQRNVYSQTGEDGIIEKILDILPKKINGASSLVPGMAIHLSNVRNLIESKGYSAVLIEANKDRFRDLQNNYLHRDDVIAVNKFVGFAEEDSLDQILTNISLPQDFDFLSIDIDGNDYHVWKSLPSMSMDKNRS